MTVSRDEAKYEGTIALMRRRDFLMVIASIVPAFKARGEPIPHDEAEARQRLGTAEAEAQAFPAIPRAFVLIHAAECWQAIDRAHSVALLNRCASLLTEEKSAGWLCFPLPLATLVSTAAGLASVNFNKALALLLYGENKCQPQQAFFALGWARVEPERAKRYWSFAHGEERKIYLGLLLAENQSVYQSWAEECMSTGTPFDIYSEDEKAAVRLYPILAKEGPATTVPIDTLTRALSIANNLHRQSRSYERQLPWSIAIPAFGLLLERNESAAMAYIGMMEELARRVTNRAVALANLAALLSKHDRERANALYGESMEEAKVGGTIMQIDNLISIACAMKVHDPTRSREILARVDRLIQESKKRVMEVAFATMLEAKSARYFADVQPFLRQPL